MKVKFSVLSLLVIASLLLAACGGGGTATEPVGGAVTQPVAEPTEMMEPTEAMTEAPTEAMTEEPTEMATEAPTEAMTEAPTEPAATGEIMCGEAQPGDEVSMLYQWSGGEEEKLNAALKPLIDACGIVIAAESTREQGILDTRVQAGNPPDIAFWNISQLEQYADQLVPVDDLVGENSANYNDFWQELGSINGTWYGLPVKADVKSIIWYSPANFDALGYTVPETWADLEALVEQMVADGNVPWAMGMQSDGGSTGWTGSDFIEDILLVQQGPEFVRGLLDGSIPYDDPGVVQAYETYGKWARDPKYTVGGAEGTLATPFNDAILQVFSDPPQAMMVKQSGFAAGTIVGTYPDLVYGEDYDFFMVPEIQGLQGGTDWMMAFSDEPAVRAVFSYLTSELGAQSWAAQTFDISPNNLGAAGYVDEALAKRADMLYNAEAFVPDIGDTIPGGFGTAEWTAIVDYVNGNDDLATLLAQPAQIQAENTGE